jgi:hypothetical protein
MARGLRCMMVMVMVISAGWLNVSDQDGLGGQK